MARTSGHVVRQLHVLQCVRTRLLRAPTNSLSLLATTSHDDMCCQLGHGTSSVVSNSPLLLSCTLSQPAGGVRQLETNWNNLRVHHRCSSDVTACQMCLLGSATEMVIAEAATVTRSCSDSS